MLALHSRSIDVNHCLNEEAVVKLLVSPNRVDAEDNYGIKMCTHFVYRNRLAIARTTVLT